MSYFQHSTAIVDEGASIGEGTNVWHWTHISAGAVIGSNCVLGQNVFIANKVVIGNGVKIQNNVSVFDCVTLEDDVFCGPGVVFTNVKNPRAFIDRKHQYTNTIVKCGATLGANATIVCGVSIGEYAFIAAGALINKNIPPFALYAGVPAKQIGWMTKNAEKMPPFFMDEGKYVCPDTGDHYTLKNNRIRLTRFEK